MSRGSNGEPTSIKELGWRQGAILPAPLAERIFKEHRGAGDPEAGILLVVSHDCDVTNGGFDNEPLVELLHAVMIDASQRDGALSYGKNPRKIQFEVQVDGETRFARASAHDRFFVPRKILLDGAPDLERSCTPLAIRQISDWLARRYVRVAFPDAFNERTRPAQSHINKALKSGGRYITGLYLAVDHWEELDEGETYNVTIVATMQENNFDIPARRQVAQRALDTIEARLGACDGVAIIEATLDTERDVSLADLRWMRRFDFDHLSLRDEEGDLAPRG